MSGMEDGFVSAERRETHPVLSQSLICVPRGQRNGDELHEIRMLLLLESVHSGEFADVDVVLLGFVVLHRGRDDGWVDLALDSTFVPFLKHSCHVRMNRASSRGASGVLKG